MKVPCNSIIYLFEKRLLVSKCMECPESLKLGNCTTIVIDYFNVNGCCYVMNDQDLRNFLF